MSGRYLVITRPDESCPEGGLCVVRLLGPFPAGQRAAVRAVAERQALPGDRMHYMNATSLEAYFAPDELAEIERMSE